MKASVTKEERGENKRDKKTKGRDKGQGEGGESPGAEPEPTPAPTLGGNTLWVPRVSHCGAGVSSASAGAALTSE